MPLWTYFIYFAAASLMAWAVGAWNAWRGRERLAIALTAAGLVVFAAYIIAMWTELEHPPMRTMGETRLWYSFFLPVAGLFVYARFRFRWVLAFAALMSAMFIGINLAKPEIHTTALMPALQSPWFAPHVAVYMMAYALLGAAALLAVWGLIRGERKTATKTDTTPKLLAATDALVNAGWALLTFGICFGAIWAKEAWGAYWTWDPKETWAAATWLAYLAYIHHRLASAQTRHTSSSRAAFWLLIAAFVLLQVTWWGINYLPAAQGTSLHTYSTD